MRRPTLIVLIVLLSLLIAAGIWQLQLAGQDHGPLPGPTSPGDLPSPLPTDRAATAEAYLIVRLG